MKKKLLPILFTMLTSMVGTNALAHDIEIKNDDGVTIYYDWTNNNTELAVSYRGYSLDTYDNEYSGKVVIPESVEYNGKSYRVTSIADYAFFDCTNLKTVIIPNSVTSIGESAFSLCDHLTSVNIPDNVSSIANSVFNNCTSLTSITIPQSVTSIGYSAFEKCENLASITIPQNVVSIGDLAFASANSKLTTVTVERKDPIAIEKNTFTNRTNATLYIPFGSKAAYEAADYWKDFNIVEGSAPNGIINFADTNVKAICLNYWDTDGDEELSMAEAAAVTNLGMVFYGKPITEFNELQYFTGLTSICREAFEGCTDLTSIIIPNNVTTIDKNAFSGCFSLNSLTIPNSVTTIDNSAFSGCSSLKSLTIQDGVTSIGDNAFYYCSSLESITIPNSVTSIGSGAFQGCSSLASITISNSVTFIGSGAFNGTPWYNTWYNNQPDGLIYIGKIAYKYKGKMPANTSINILNGTVSIGVGAFSSCSGLVSVSIPNSVTNIGINAFQYCSALTSITIPKSVTNIESTAYRGCNALTSMIVEDGNTTYDSRDNCNAIIETSSNTLIAGCKSTVIPSTVTAIGWDAFNDCANLTTIIIPDNVTSIGIRAFYNCDGLTSISIPNKVTSIGFRAFADCDNLASITIPATVTNIGEYAFNPCPKLKSVTVENPTPVAIEAGTFDNQYNAKLYVPAGSVEAYQAANYWKDFTVVANIAYAVYDNGTLTFKYGEFTPNGTTSWDVSNTPSDPSDYFGGFLPSSLKLNNSLKHVVFDKSFAEARPKSCAAWFATCHGLETIEGLEYLNTSEVTSMFRMFEDCPKLTSLDLSHFDTSNVGNMENMFAGATGLTVLDLSSFNTSKVTNIEHMFAGLESDPLKLKKIYVGDGWSTSSAEWGLGVFDYCTSLVGGNGTTFSTDHMDWTYARIDEPGKPGYLTKKAATIEQKIAYAVYDNGTLTFKYGEFTPDNENSWDVSNTPFNGFLPSSLTWEGGLKHVVFDASFAEARPKSCSYWFDASKELESIEGLEYLNTSEVTSMSCMFEACPKLTSLDLSHFDTSNVTDMGTMFAGATGLTVLDLSSFNTAKVANMDYMFAGSEKGTQFYSGPMKLKKIYVGDGWSAGGGTKMFEYCTSLVGGNGTTYSADHIDYTYARIDEPGKPGYLTKKTAMMEQNIAYAVYDNGTLTFKYGEFTPNGTTSWDVSDTGAQSFTDWDLRMNGPLKHVVFDPSFANARPKSCFAWFDACNNLEDIIGLEYLNTSEVTTMNCMFEFCPKLTSLDLTHFDTSNVTDMGNMFAGATGMTTLDLSSFNTSKVTIMTNMFAGSASETYGGSNKVETIYVGDGWTTAGITSASNGARMFDYCPNLKGGNGTPFNADHTDYTYARIDEPGKPGYLTKKSDVTTTVWTVTSTDNIPAGTKYELDDITLTIGEAGSNDFTVNEWGGPYDETFNNLITGNGENGDKEGGTFYLFTPKKNGNLTVFVSQNPVKKLFVEESGRVMDAFNGISHEEITEGQYRGTYTIPVYANLTYKLYCAGSKLSFYGFTYEGRNDAEVANITFADEKVKTLCVAKWDTNKDGELSFAEAAAVTNINGVFNFNKEITSFDELRFFTGLTSLSFGALNECFELKSVCIPSSIVEMDGGAFASCHKLEYIGVDASNPKFKSYGTHNAVIERAANRLVVGCREAIIPDNITTIGEAAFWGHAGEWKDIPASVTKIDEGAFAYGGLNAVNISANVEYIGEAAFRCNSLWEVVIPAKVTYIGEDAFNECYDLGKVTVLNPNPIELINAETFNNRANATLYVPVGSKAAYKAAPIWQDFNIVSAIPEGTIIPWGTEQAWEMKYVYFDEIGNEPGTDGAGHAWTDAEFDDSSWATLTGPIARNEHDFSVVNTIWEQENSCYYLRRTFNLDEVNEQGYYFCSHHDDNVKVWINGTQVVDAGFNGRYQYHHIPASAFVKGTNTMAIYLDDMGGGANLDYCMTNFYFLKNVETGKYLNAGDGWRAVLTDEGLPVKLYKQADGSYTIYFPYGSQNQQLLYRVGEERVFVDYSKDWAQYGVCPNWTFTDAGEGHIYIQSLTTDPTYGQEAMPGTYLGNNPSSNYVDGNITVGNNITWTVEALPAPTETQKARLQELVTTAKGLWLDTSEAEAVLNNNEATYIDMLGTILELQNSINDKINAKVQDLNKLIACADAIGVSTSDAQAVADNPQNMESVNNAISTLRTTYIAKLGEGVDASLLPLDVTGAIINPTFAINDADGWSWKDGEDGPDFGSSTAEYRERTFDFHQTVSGLPNGSYLLKVKGFHRPANKDEVFADYMQGTDNAKAKFYANGKSVTLKNAAAEAQEHEVDGWSGLDVTYNEQTRYIPHENYDANTWFLAGYYENELPFTVSDGTLTFGISLDESVNDDWVCFDDFRLILSDNAIDVSQLPNAIYADDQTGNVGRTFTMDIKLKNEKTVRAYSFDLQLPEGVTIAKDANDDYEMELSGRHDSYAPTVNYVESSNTYRLATTSRVVGNDGVIMTLRLQVSDQMPTGKYFIRILNAIYTQADNYQDIHMPDISAKLTIGEKTYTKGDVNDDDDVDIADVVCVVNHVVGVETPRYYEAAADVTGDNDVTISDAAKIVDYIIGEIDALGPIAATVRRLALSRSLNDGVKTGILDVSTLNDALYANDLNVEPGKNALLTISLKNTETTNGYSFDLILPDGVTLAKDGNNKYLCELSSRHDKTHGVNIKYKEDTRTYSVLVYSQSSKSLSGNDSEVLTFTLAVTNALGNNTTLSIQNCKYSLTSGAASVPLPREEVKLNKGPKGDADGNGKINMSDVIIMLSYILGENPENFNIYAADMNSDGKVTVTDVLLMYGLIP